MSARHYCLDETSPTACGRNGYGFGATTDLERVTCKRCLASLAKRDREFRQKARRRFKTFDYAQRNANFLDAVCRLDINSHTVAARAIAREEGRL